MPGGRKPKQDATLRNQQNHLLWEQTGSMDNYQLLDWEPRYQELVDALLEVLSTGAAVMMRPGSGGRAVGIAIWEGDVRHPAKWLYDQDEIDLWSAGIIETAKRRRGVKEEG